jgi:hypothetical protein
MGDSETRTFILSVSGKRLRVFAVVAFLGIAAFATRQLWIAQPQLNVPEGELTPVAGDMETPAAEAEVEARVSVSSLSDELANNEIRRAKSSRRSARHLAAVEEIPRTCTIDMANQLNTLERDRWGGLWLDDSLSTQCSEFMHPVNNSQGD